MKEIIKQKSKMDWYTIEYLYPFAYRYFIGKVFPNTGIVSNSLLQLFDQKTLFRFFDGESIFLTTEIIGSEMQWMFTVRTNNFTISDNTSRTTREEIEADGFHKCFEYLETRLRNTKLIGE